MKIKIIFRWFDFYMGAYYNKENQILYIFPIPTLGVKITLLPKGYSIQKTKSHNLNTGVNKNVFILNTNYDWSPYPYQIGTFDSFFEAFYYAYHHKRYSTYDK
jgi:hypothetical protein